MKIDIVTPTESGVMTGNEVTGKRWLEILKKLGHEVRLNPDFQNCQIDLLVAIHATRSFDFLQAFKTSHPTTPVFLCLAGTDYNLDLKGERGVSNQEAAEKSMMLADRLIGIQDYVAAELPEEFRSKVEVIIQSAIPIDNEPEPFTDCFEVLFVGNIRPVKGPFVGVEALQFLPDQSRIKLIHFGGAFDPEMRQKAESLSRSIDRYDWLGPKPAKEVRYRIARSQLLIMTSVAEGAPNVISESCVLGTPVLATEIPGATGLLGKDYPGYFPVGDARSLSDLLWKFESDQIFRQELIHLAKKLAPKFSREKEIQRWKELLSDFFDLS